MQENRSFYVKQLAFKGKNSNIMPPFFSADFPLRGGKIEFIDLAHIKILFPFPASGKEVGKPMDKWEDRRYFRRFGSCAAAEFVG